MLSEDERKAIEFFKECIIKDHLFEEDFTLYNMKIFLNLITKLQKEVEHQKEKRENQKVELSILNEKQKEMNKLKNTVSSYCGMFKKQEKKIKELQKENEEIKEENISLFNDLKNWKKLNSEKNKQLLMTYKQIDLTTEALSAVCTGISSVREQLEKSYCEFINNDEDCCSKTDKSCKDCIFEYFEKLAKEKK